MIVSERTLTRAFISAVFAALLVLMTIAGFLARGLPETAVDPLKYPSLGFNFAFGSGETLGNQLIIDEFADGYALLTSGPVSIKANAFRVLRFTWLPTEPVQEAAFFWRRSDDAGNLIRTDITTPGSNLVDLTTESDWRGEIIEFGFLVAGTPGQTVEINGTSMEPDTIEVRLELMWKGWTAFEGWSQRSVNFLNGGKQHQVVSLPVVVIAWLVITIVLLWLASAFGRQRHKSEIAAAAGLLFLSAWIILDIRWTGNNIQQTQRSLQYRWLADDQQRLSMGLDAELYQYAEKLKKNILGDEKSRVLIIGDENTGEYFLLKAKYHLLPHSAAIARQFSRKTAPESLDFVFFLGDPREIVNIPGWNRDWQYALTEVNRGDWGVVFRVGN